MVSPGSSIWMPPLRILRGRGCRRAANTFFPPFSIENGLLGQKTKGREEAQLPPTPEEELLYLGPEHEREVGCGHFGIA